MTELTPWAQRCGWMLTGQTKADGTSRTPLQAQSFHVASQTTLCVTSAPYLRRFCTHTFTSPRGEGGWTQDEDTGILGASKESIFLSPHSFPSCAPYFCTIWATLSCPCPGEGHRIAQGW